MTSQPPRRPGDKILDRVMPDATPEERELAHERLRGLAKVLIGIQVRIENERQAQATVDREMLHSS